MTVSSAQIANQLKAIADPLRVSIVQVASRRAFGVVELAEIFAVAQPSMSHHLKKLAAEGWLVSRREGNSIYYRRAACHSPIYQSIFNEIDQLAVASDIQHRLESADRKRQARSQAFFEQHSATVAKQTELISSLQDYADVVSSLLPKGEAVLEIGPGLGEFLPMLCRTYDSVDAVDLSSAMIDACTALINANGLSASVVLGNAGTQLDKSGSFDVAVSNMVLHHVPQPQQLIAQIARQLKDGGYWVVSELVSHEQNWTIDACGDLWLGFEEKQLETWASDEQFILDQRDCIALNNGFNIFVHRYRLPK